VSQKVAVIDRPPACVKFAGLLSAFLDEGLDVRATGWAARHRDDCPACGPEASAIADVRSAVRALGVPPERSIRRIREWLSSIR